MVVEEDGLDALGLSEDGIGAARRAIVGDGLGAVGAAEAGYTPDALVVELRRRGCPCHGDPRGHPVRCDGAGH